MKNIGVLGGMSSKSTIEYYRIFIEESEKLLGEKRNPEIIIYNLNFYEFYSYMKDNEYSEATELLSDKINKLDKAGADFALLASNTPHLLLDEIKKKVQLPLLDIVESTANEALREGYSKLGLIGTAFTTKKDFYKDGLMEKDLEVFTPNEDQIRFINKKIFDEFTEESPSEKTINKIKKIVSEMEEEKGIDAVILGCTELPLYLNDKNLGISTINTTSIHAKEAINKAIEE